MVKQDSPAAPIIFGRWADTLIVNNAAAPVPPNEPGLDWEVELAVVIGSIARGVDRAGALDHVLGYTVFNDLSVRRKQLETSQFTLGKNSDHSGPIGPVIVTRNELPDISSLWMETRIGSEIMQSGNTRDMIHDVAKLIAYISDPVTLKPGDVIATGTPAGVGMGMKPPRYLQPGEVVEVEIEQIGTLTTPIVAWDADRRQTDLSRAECPTDPMSSRRGAAELRRSMPRMMIRFDPGIGARSIRYRSAAAHASPRG